MDVSEQYEKWLEGQAIDELAEAWRDHYRAFRHIMSAGWHSDEILKEISRRLPTV